jgi:hypothetical protein
MIAHAHLSLTSSFSPPIASMVGFSASQAWDHIKVNAGRDFNVNINGSGEIMKERGMDHSHDVASDDGMACRKATGDHGAC